jgi:Ras GTPase-activating protein 1
MTEAAAPVPLFSPLSLSFFAACGASGLKSGKWKYLHFALNAKDQQLCFYENEKRVKPKGLVDLSYTFLYPVHDSLFDRTFCFQLVERTIPCISTYYYLSADSAESAMEWVQALKPLCAAQQSKNRSSPLSSNICHTNLISAGNEITQVRTLYVTLCQAYRLPVKLLPHPYCLISLNQVKVARTQVKCPPDPVWEEDFVLEEIPSDVTSFSVILLNKRKESKSTEVASLELELTSLNNGEEMEKCFNLNGLQTPLRDDYGSLRLKIRFVHEVIMPFREYTILKELLMNSDLQVHSSHS